MTQRTCKTCGGTRFIVAETRMLGCRAPTVECADCRRLDADGVETCTRSDLDSARMAIAANLGVVSDWNDEADTVVDHTR